MFYSYTLDSVRMVSDLKPGGDTLNEMIQNLPKQKLQVPCLEGNKFV